jgi:hypothetical protein
MSNERTQSYLRLSRRKLEPFRKLPRRRIKSSSGKRHVWKVLQT